MDDQDLYDGLETQRSVREQDQICQRKSGRPLLSQLKADATDKSVYLSILCCDSVEDDNNGKGCDVGEMEAYGPMAEKGNCFDIYYVAPLLRNKFFMDQRRNRVYLGRLYFEHPNIRP